MPIVFWIDFFYVFGSDGGLMVLEFYYAKNGHTYRERARSYKELDEKMQKRAKEGYMIVGGNFYV